MIRVLQHTYYSTTRRWPLDWIGDMNVIGCERNRGRSSLVGARVVAEADGVLRSQSHIRIESQVKMNGGERRGEEAYLGLVNKGLRVVVRVTGEGVARLLRGGLLGLGLQGGCGGVGLALEGVTDLLGGRLLGVGLQGGAASGESKVSTRVGEEEGWEGRGRGEDAYPALSVRD